MVRASIKIVRIRGVRNPVVFYQLHDSEGRLIGADNTSGQWDQFMRRAEREVGALRVLEEMGHRTEHTWSELVDMAEI